MDDLGQAEPHQLDVARGAQKDVFGFQVLRGKAVLAVSSPAAINKNIQDHGSVAKTKTIKEI